VSAATTYRRRLGRADGGGRQRTAWRPVQPATLFDAAPPETIVPVDAQDLAGAAVREAGPVRDGEIGPARDGETGPARDGETGPARDGETGPARDGETGPARDGETGPARDGETGPAGDGEAGGLHRPAGSGETLDRLVVGGWERLASPATAACLLCAGAMEPVYAAHARPIGGRCRDCGTTLS
jgi:hypothetical protein